MEERCGQIDPPQSNKITISLEDYLDFVDSGKELGLTVTTLNQIISMHGFSKQKTQKNKLIDALNTIKLMNLSRSTIHNNGVSSLAYIPMEEAIADLLNLNWQECSVVSIQTLNYVNHDFNQNSPASASKSDSRKRKSRPKNMKRKVLGSKRVEADEAIVTVATDEANSDDKQLAPSREAQPTDRKPYNSPSFKHYYTRKKIKKSVHASTTGSNSARGTRKVKTEEYDEADVVKHGLVFKMLSGGVNSSVTFEVVRQGLLA